MTLQHRPLLRTLTPASLPFHRRAVFLPLLLLYLLSLVPETRLSQEARRPGGQCQAEGEAKDTIDRAEEIQTASDLCFQLGAGNEGG